MTLYTDLNLLLKDQLLLTPQKLETLLAEMLENIGSTDPILRDQLIYASFCHLINDEKLLTGEHLNMLFETCLDDQHLFWKIGEENTDSVFTRSFSALVLAAILFNDQAKPTLPVDLISQAFVKTCTYFELENDTRGHVTDNGWAHSIAHAADLLVALVMHPTFELAASSYVLAAIEQALLKPANYADEEDERLLTVIEALLNRGLAIEVLEYWLKSLFSQLQGLCDAEGLTDLYYRRKVNQQYFVKSLYFCLKFRGGYSGLMDLISQQLFQLQL